MIDTSLPPWLQRNLAQKESFDPSPWLNEAFNQNVQRAKLPLQLQGYELQNKATQLAIEHQGIQNDLANQEMNNFAQDLPIYRSAIESASKLPGGSVSMQTPMFKSKQALTLWQERQKSDAATAFGQAIHQATIADVKAVTDAMRITGKKINVGPNGEFDPVEKAKLLNEAHIQEMADKGALYKIEHPGLEKPQAVTVKDDQGNPITMVQVGPDSWKPVEETTTEITTPSGEKLSIKTGAKGAGLNTSGLNPAVNTELEKKISASDMSLSLLDEAIKKINSSNVGPIGVTKEFLEKAANVLAPGSMPTTVSDAREVFRVVAQQQFAALKADSQINKLEASAMRDIADITRIDMASPVAIGKYQTLRDLTALQNMLRHHQLNRIAPDNVLDAMSIGQIARAFDRGDATKAEVLRWNEIHQVVK